MPDRTDAVGDSTFTQASLPAETTQKAGERTGANMRFGEFASD